MALGQLQASQGQKKQRKIRTDRRETGSDCPRAEDKNTPLLLSLQLQQGLRCCSCWIILPSALSASLLLSAPCPAPGGAPHPICPMNAKVLMLPLSLCNFPASRLLLHVGPIHMPLECAPFKEDLEFLKWHSHLMTGIQRKDKPPV